MYLISCKIIPLQMFYSCNLEHDWCMIYEGLNSILKTTDQSSANSHSTLQ